MPNPPLRPDADPRETDEWLESIDSVLDVSGPARTRFLVRKLIDHAQHLRIGLPALVQTPYVNTIKPEDEPDYPGDEQLEKRIRRLVRWNSVVQVIRANKLFVGLGGHLSTYASAATIYEVGFNHFFRSPERLGGGDHAASRFQRRVAAPVSAWRWAAGVDSSPRAWTQRR
ncbi:MAG: hypothetical protein KDC38_06105, partial [Planctomycetes bacterium]|nr:hypothetical protein [Planctomycetota bacterium]